MVLIIENQPDISTLLGKYPNTFLCTVTKNIDDSYNILKHFNIDLVCINLYPFNSDILDCISNIKRINQSTKVLGILPLEFPVIEECIAHGVDEYLLMNTYSNMELQCRILKLLHIPCPCNIEVKSVGDINFIPYQREMYIKKFRVKLTHFECIFLNYTINRKGYCNINNFVKYISKINSKPIDKMNMVTSINRLKKKVYILTGYKVIKSRYGFGYYIDT